jgi:hypothetical protein
LESPELARTSGLGRGIPMYSVTRSAIEARLRRPPPAPSSLS